MKKYIWIFAIAFIMIPISLNIIIGFEAPNNIQVIGDPSAWLQFYGEYIGGVLTAIIAFAILYIEGKRNKTSIEIAYKRETLKELERTLAECVSLFDYSRIGIISLFLNNTSKYDDALFDLHEYYCKIKTTANAWAVIYEGSYQDEAREFQISFENSCQYLITKINEMTALIYELKQETQGDQRNEIINKINKVNNKEREYRTTCLEPMYRNAKRWIDSEKSGLQQLKDKLNKLL